MSSYFQQPYQRAFGTFPLTGAQLANAIGDAIDVGYRAFDTAQMYGNEAGVGAALRAAGATRSELCITTKVHPDNFTAQKFLPSVSLVVPQGPPKDEEAPGVAASGVQCEAETAQVRPGRISWARLLKRVLAAT